MEKKLRRDKPMTRQEIKDHIEKRGKGAEVTRAKALIKRIIKRFNI